MAPKIVTISDRGQITLPKKVRQQFKVKMFTVEVKQGGLLLTPVQTREEFFAELEMREKDWEKHGGSSWDEVMKKADL